MELIIYIYILILISEFNILFIILIKILIKYLIVIFRKTYVK